MKTQYQIAIIFLIISLSFLNVIFFAHTIATADETQKMENQIEQLKITNLDLSKQLSSINSIDNLASDALKMGFVQQAQPITLDHFSAYALAK